MTRDVAYVADREARIHAADSTAQSAGDTIHVHTSCSTLHRAQKLLRYSYLIQESEPCAKWFSISPPEKLQRRLVRLDRQRHRRAHSSTSIQKRARGSLFSKVWVVQTDEGVLRMIYRGDVFGGVFVFSLNTEIPDPRCCAKFLSAMSL